MILGVFVMDFMNHRANTSQSMSGGVILIASLTTARSVPTIAHWHCMLSTIIQGPDVISKACANLIRGSESLHGQWIRNFLAILIAIALSSAPATSRLAATRPRKLHASLIDDFCHSWPIETSRLICSGQSEMQRTNGQMK